MYCFTKYIYIGILCQKKLYIYTDFKKILKKILKLGILNFWGMEKYFDSSLMEIEDLYKIEKTILLLSKKRDSKFRNGYNRIGLIIL